MAISGAFAGLAGAIDTVGWAYRINTNDVMISSQIAFVGIAVALLGRNKAIGIGLSALLFASLVTGTSTQKPRPGDLPARAGVEPDGDDPGPRRPLRRRRRAHPLAVRPPEAATAAACRGGPRRMIGWVSARRPSNDRVPRVDRHRLRADRILGRAPAAQGANGMDPARDRPVRDHLRRRRADPRPRPPARLVRDRDQRSRHRPRSPRHPLERGPPRPGDRLVGADGGDAPPRDAARLRRDGRHLLRAQRRREHRPRGDDALGRLLRDPRRGQVQLVAARPPLRGALRRCVRADPRLLRDPPPRRPDRRRHRDQLPGARDHRLPLHRHLRRRRDAAGHPRHPQRAPVLPRGLVLHRARARQSQPDDLARVPDDRRSRGSSSSRRRSASASAPSASIRARPTRSGSPSTRRATPRSSSPGSSRRSAARTSRSGSSTPSTRT